MCILLSQFTGIEFKKKKQKIVEQYKYTIKMQK